MCCFLFLKTRKLSECRQNLTFLFSLNRLDMRSPKQRPLSCLSPASLPEPSLLPLLFSISDISLFSAHTICLSPLCFLNSFRVRRGSSQWKFKSKLFLCQVEIHWRDNPCLLHADWKQRERAEKRSNRRKARGGISHTRQGENTQLFKSNLKSTRTP